MHPYHFVDIPGSLHGKRVLLRVDFNEPLKNGRIENSFRVRKTLPTIQELKRRGAKIILVAHIEDSRTKKQLSFAPLINDLERVLKMRLSFVRRYTREAVLLGIASHSVVLLENVRFERGEEKNDPRFAWLLASYADIYINEAFSVSHRSHASIVGVPLHLSSFAGPLFKREVSRLSEALRPPHPFLLIVGGAKFDTKFALLKAFIPKADTIFLGGILANTFLLAEGVRIGNSLVERGAFTDIHKHFFKSKKILLPFDVRTSTYRKGESVFMISSRDKIHDVGPETVRMLLEIARRARLVVWNGPLGYIEGGYVNGTKDLIRGLARAKTKIVLGGGDTLSVLDDLRLHGKFYHVSTGGGAMLDFLADGSLPGINAILKAQRRAK